MKKAMYLLTTLVFLMGVAHIALTPATFEAYSLDALWFVGSGLALVLLSFLNLIILLSEKRRLFLILGLVGNLLGIGLIASILAIVNQPHIIFLFMLLVIQTVLLLLNYLKGRKGLL